MVLGRWTLGVAIGGAALGLGAFACGSDDTVSPVVPPAEDGGAEAAAPPEPFKATVRRTSFGVPHVTADDFGGLGYGYGYAFSEDNLCILQEEILTVRGRRAEFLGDIPYDLGQTSSKSNVASDAFYKMEFSDEVATRYRDAQPAELRAVIRGYAAGVNRYVRELQSGKHEGRHAACRAEPWVREIDELDLYLRFYKLNLLASSAGFIDGIAAAAPPGASAVPAPPPGAMPSAAELREGLTRVAPNFMAQKTGELGSNMYAFGKDLTGGPGIQFGNPHFPWYGGERLYQVHLTIPGKMDVEGASLYGAPVVLIGFTENLAWSHTVSTAYRFTPYALSLKPGDPLTYLKDGQEKKIQVVTLTIKVKGEADRTVKRYRSEYGPMIYLGNDLFSWTTERAFTIRDANMENTGFLRHYFRWNQAKDLAEFKKIHAEEVAVPWVNTTAADKDGNVYYGDISVVPHVTDDQAKACEVPFLSSTLGRAAPGLPLLDGSKASCDWGTDADAPRPGIFGAKNLPTRSATDHVLNCNDSFWLSNAKAPITGFARIIGAVGTPQSLRSRLCHKMVSDRVAGTDGLGAAGTVNAEQVRQMVLSSRVYSAESEKKTLTDALCVNPTITLTKDPLTNAPVSPSEEITITEACAALTAWDGTNNADSKGSLLWDELWFRVEAASARVLVYTTPFDANDPVSTPRGLKTDEPEIAQALAAAVRSVKAAGFPFDAPRSAVSFREGKGGERIAVPGGFQSTGNFTIAQVRRPSLKAGTGYGPMLYGNSYLQVVTFGPNGVEPHTFVTYSQSSDPASPHYDDYTRAYGKKEWLRAPFREAEIAADEKSKITLEQ